MLPFVAYRYHYLAENMLSYADSERYLGVHMNINFNFSGHCENTLVPTTTDRCTLWTVSTLHKFLVMCTGPRD